MRVHYCYDPLSFTRFFAFSSSASGGELQTLIDEKGMLSEAKTRICMRDILRAVQHMHRHSIAHLDLKPQNILLTGTDVEGTVQQLG